jgi:hypothetical protein
MLYTTASSMYHVYVKQHHSSTTVSRDNYMYAGSHIPGDARMYGLHHLPHAVHVMA